LSPLARYLVWAKDTLIVFGVVLVFVEIPSGTLIYPIAGLVVFAGLTLFDSAPSACGMHCGVGSVRELTSERSRAFVARRSAVSDGGIRSTPAGRARADPELHAPVGGFAEHHCCVSGLNIRTRIRAGDEPAGPVFRDDS
jgi:hypothetical protein